jgi:predicted nucleic acid-binding protein
LSRAKSRRARADLPSRVFVDTGAFVGLLSAADGHHDEADALFRAAARDRVRLLTTNLVVAEVHRLVLFEVGIAAAFAAVTHMTESALLEIVYSGPDHHPHALAWLKKLSDQRITYTDAMSFAVMARAHCRVAMTFDSDFEIAGYERWRLS